MTSTKPARAPRASDEDVRELRRAVFETDASTNARGAGDAIKSKDAAIEALAEALASRDDAIAFKELFTELRP